MYEPRDIPRAYTKDGISHDDAGALGTAWARATAKDLGAPVTIYAPQRQNLTGTNISSVMSLLASGLPIHTHRGGHPGGGVVIALWPTEEMLLRADEDTRTAALVAVTWAIGNVQNWANAHDATVLGGDQSTPTVVNAVIAAAVQTMGIISGQHKPIDQTSRAEIAACLDLLRSDGYRLEPDVLHTAALRSGWRADNAAQLREVASRLNEGRTIQGMKSARIRDDLLQQWQHPSEE